ncbi:hypothetical protein SD81_035655, partial [Tolypothrix campylonemoides VB511288]
MSPARLTRTRPHVAPLPLVIALVLSTPVRGQQTPVDFDSVVVQGSKTGETLEETPASVTVLDARTLDEA